MSASINSSQMFRAVAAVILAMAVLPAIRPAGATSFYWDADGTSSAATGGSGNWNLSSTVWRSGSDTGSLVAWPVTGGNNDAVLAGSAGILTLMTAVPVNDLSIAPISAGSYVITGSQTLTLGGSAQSIIDIAGGSSLTITSGLAGFNGFRKTGSGTLVLDSVGATNILFGSITVSSGTLQAGSATNSGASLALRSNAVSLGSGTTLSTLGSTIDLRLGAVSGSGSITPASGGAVFSHALTDATYSGTINASGGFNLRGANGTTQILNGNLVNLAGNISVNSGATLRITGTGDSTSGVLGSIAINPRGGTLVLDNSAGNTSAVSGRLADAAILTMLGGKFQLVGNSGGTTETLGELIFFAGAATISVTHSGGASGTVLGFTDSGTLRDTAMMTVNFEGAGGTLGSAGANPRITFTGSGIFTNLTNGALALTSSTSAREIGWATVNSNSWAGIGANGIVALSEANRSSSNLGSAGAFEVTNFAPSSTLTTLSADLGTTSSPLLLKISPTGSGQSLSAATFAINAVGVMLVGTTDFSVTGTSGTFFGGVGVSRYVHTMDANTTLNVSVSLAGANQPVVKSGSGFLNLNGSGNQLAFTTNQNVSILQGVLRGTTTSLGGGSASGGAFTTLNLYGGVLEISGGGTFLRALNIVGTSGGGGIKWDNGGATRGDGGFSAIGGNAVVTLLAEIGKVAPSPLAWNYNGFVPNGHALLMGSVKSDSRMDFTNGISFDDPNAPNVYVAREVRVTDNVNSLSDITRLSGTLTGSAYSDLLKTGGGVLELTGNNSYSGNTLVRQGTLQISNSAGSATGTGNVIVTGSGTLGGTGTVSGASFVTSGGTVTAGPVSGATTVGTITLGKLTLDTGGHVLIDINKTGNTADQLIATGAVALGSGVAVLDLSLSDQTSQSYTPSFVILRNDSAVALSGFFAGMDPGAGTTALFTNGRLQLTIDYAYNASGSDGVANDVRLTFITVPEPTRIGFASVGGGLLLRRRRRDIAC